MDYNVLITNISEIMIASFKLYTEKNDMNATILITNISKIMISSISLYNIYTINIISYLKYNYKFKTKF